MSVLINSIILSSGLFGSIYLFTVSLNNLNIILSYNPLINLTNNSRAIYLRNGLILLNGSIMVLSCYTFYHLTSITTK
jgi:hypothetical protein